MTNAVRLSPVKTASIATLMLSLLLALPISVQAKNEKAENRASAAQETKSSETTGETVLDSVLKESTRSILNNYFATNPQPVKPLPPGIAKNLKRGKPLPPGIAKRSLPNDLTRQIQAQDSSIGDVIDAIIVGSDIAVIDAATGVVVEILKDIVRPQ